MTVAIAATAAGSVVVKAPLGPLGPWPDPSRGVSGSLDQPSLTWRDLHALLFAKRDYDDGQGFFCGGQGVRVVVAQDLAATVQGVLVKVACRPHIAQRVGVVG